MFANICLSEVFPDASKQHHPLLENTTHQQTFEKQSRSCEVCGKIFKYLGCLENHRQNHRQKHAEVQRGGQCEFCDKPFKSKYKLNVHRRKHAENDPTQFVAYMPAALPIIKEEMRQKMIKEAMMKQNSSRCERCGRCFNRISTLNRHIRDVAEKGRCVAILPGS